jgi:complex iron-sulfur molybdoenzyme family reductase subunit gamma
MMRKTTIVPACFLLGLVLAATLPAQQAPAGGVAAGLTLPVGASAVETDILLDSAASAWQQFPARRLALNRTPPLYDTDPPATLEIPTVDVRVARAAGKLFVHMSWRDSSSDSASLPAAPDAPPEQRDRKVQTLSTGRFFDAAAVMVPAGQSGSIFTPSLQMGDPQHPVTIYYWNAARGAMLMQAHGRSTTHRTGDTFTAHGVYRAGTWQVVLELPDLATGAPLAFAVWNGSQLDRDGRKYFSVWHWLQ